MQRLLIFHGCPVRNANFWGRHHVKKRKNGTPKKISNPMHPNECPKVSNGNKKGKQNQPKSEFQSKSGLMLIFGQAWLK